MIVLTSPTLEKFVSSAWGADRSYRGGVHEGLDFPTPIGAPVLAAADGLVTRVKNVDNSFAGRFIVIDHGGGISTRYLHNTKNLVTEGQRVSQGQKIATAGITGTSGRSKPHVHFDMKLSDSALAEYKRRYGEPEPGFGGKTAIGRGAPSETFMSGVKYRPEAKAASKARGVVFYRSQGLLALAVLGGGFVLYKLASS